TFGQHSTPQHLGMLTPFYTRIDGMPRYAWAAYYLTREFNPETVQQLLATHSKFKITKDLKPEDALARRLRYCDFFAQAGWFEESEAELERISKDFPERKESIDASLATIGRMKARERFEEVKRLQQAGLFETARKRMAEIPESRAAEEIVSALREVRAGQDATAERRARVGKGS